MSGEADRTKNDFGTCDCGAHILFTQAEGIANGDIVTQALLVRTACFAEIGQDAPWVDMRFSLRRKGRKRDSGAVGYTSKTMGPRVLILDNAIHRFLFKPAWHWKAALGAIPADVVNLPSGRLVPRLGHYTHVILTGSEVSILTPRPWFDVEVRAILEANDRGLPILGSCFGHQMLVYALSGPACLRRSEFPEVGWIEVDMLEPDELLADVPRPWRVFSFHFDEVVDPPAPWKVLARSDRCAVHAIRYENRPMWGIQPHPEMSERKAEFFTRVYLLFYGGAGRKTITGFRRPEPCDRAIHGIVRRFLEVERAA